jgi:hypothetical protein
MLASLAAACAKSAPQAAVVEPIALPTPVADATPVAIEEPRDDAGVPDDVEEPPEDDLPGVYSSKSVEMGGGEVRRFDLEIHGECHGACSLSAGTAVSALMDDRSEYVAACFKSSGRAKVKMNLTVAPDGTVHYIDLVSFSGSENDAQCLVDVLNRTHFPTTGEPGGSMTLRFDAHTDVEPLNNP